MYVATWVDKAEMRDRTISQLGSVREVMELAGNHLFEAQFSRRSPAEFQGNGQRSRSWDREWPGMKISPVVFSVENKEQTMYCLAAVELVRSVGIVQRDVK